MKKYRIIEIEYSNGSLGYKVEKRFLGFLFWYNFLNIYNLYGETAGYFKTYQEAENALRQNRSKPKQTVCYEE